ncbi:peptidase inhibitor family I36 protein [Streptomyces hirsutus]|uniref:peptidase inhibitor family I36 protein n=1 Tax=Streptomyces hirsutus TaxID=35620 RepID=UPI003650F389
MLTLSSRAVHREMELFIEEVGDAALADRLRSALARRGPGASGSCPTEVFGNDWYCFYQYKSFKGRRLQWNAAHKDLVYFSKFDFENRTSSWSNKGAKTIKVYGRRYAGQDTSCYSPLWSENPHERSASANWDKAADCFLTN